MKHKFLDLWHPDVVASPTSLPIPTFMGGTSILWNCVQRPENIIWCHGSRERNVKGCVLPKSLVSERQKQDQKPVLTVYRPCFSIIALSFLQAEIQWRVEMVGWHHQLNGHEFEQAPGRWWRTGKPDGLQSTGSHRVGHDLVTEQQKQNTADSLSYTAETNNIAKQLPSNKKWNLKDK